MSRYRNPDDYESDVLNTLEQFILSQHHEYAYTDHPYIWTPSRSLYCLYLMAFNRYATGSAGEHFISEHGGRALTVRQHGRVLARLYEDYPRVNRTIHGKRTRGIEGLVGPLSDKCRGYGVYPAHLLDFPPPSDWTPCPFIPILPIAATP